MEHDWPNKNRKMTWAQFDELLTNKMVKMGIWRRQSMNELIHEDSQLYLTVDKMTRDQYLFDYMDRLHHAEETADLPFTPGVANS